MKEQIIELKDLFNLNISWDIFSKILLHIHDGKSSWISNNLTIEDWKKLFNEEYTEIGVNDEQVKALFKYLVTYYSKYFTFHRDKESYSVSKDFNNRDAENIFTMEKIIFTTLETLKDN